MEENNDRCQLLELPAEIRNVIFHLALVSKEARYAPLLTGNPDPARGLIIPEPGLLRSCTQIRSECLVMYYALNTFEMMDVPSARHFLAGLDGHRIAQIRRFRLDVPLVTVRRRFWLSTVDDAVNKACGLLGHYGKKSLNRNAVLIQLESKHDAKWVRLSKLRRSIQGKHYRQSREEDYIAWYVSMGYKEDPWKQEGNRL